MVNTDSTHSWIQSNSDLKAVYGRAPIGICTLDRELICVRMNATLLTSQSTTISPEGQHLNEVLPRLASHILEPVTEILATGDQQIEIEIECSGSNQQSDCLTYLADLLPVFDDAGTVVGVSCVFREVSQQRQNEQQLLLTKFSVDNSQTMIFWIKQDSSFFYVNEAAVETLGYSREELCTMKVRDIDSDYAGDDWVEFWNTVRQQKSMNFESKIQRKDGEVIPVEITTNFLEFGGEEYVFAFLLNLAEQKETQSALKESETLFRNVVETAKFGVQVCSLDGEITFANQALGDIYDCEAKDLIGKNVWELCQTEPEQIETMVRVVHHGTHSNSQKSYETKNVTLTGREIVIEINWTYDVNSEGEIVGFVVIVTDVTERTLSREMLEASEARFRALVENNNDVINLFSESGELIYTSPAIKKVLGYEQAEMLSMHPLEIIHPAEVEAAAKSFAEYAKTPGATGKLRQRLRHKDGSYRTVEVTGRNLMHVPGINAMFSVFRDISDRVEAEENLRERESQLAHVSRLCTLGEIAAGIAHEIRQPLSAIEGFAQSIAVSLESAQDDQALRDVAPNLVRWTHDIAKANQMANEIMSGWFRYSKITHDEFDSVEVDQLIQESMELTAFEAKCKQVAVTYESHPAAAVVECDRIQIQQVLINLLLNAYQSFLDSADQARIVSVQAMANEDCLEVQVSDNGMGLSEETESQLFSPFTTTKPEGMGIGLAICRTIVESHGGAITGANNESAGATFRFVIPIQRPAD